MFKNAKAATLVAIPILIIAIIAFGSCRHKWVNTDSKGVVTTQEPHFKVKAFIENSGSMDGYMCGGSEFKDAIYSYLTAVSNNADTLELNYINSQVIPLNFPLSSLVENLTPAAFAAAGGNRANSDFKQILRSVINSATTGTVTVFASDCILDMPDGAASNYLNIVRTDINNIVSQKRRQLPSLSICVYQLESRFTGTYWCPNGTPCPLNGERRPYYLWVIGSKENLAALRRKVRDDVIQHGVRNYCAFTPSAELPNILSRAGQPVNSMPLIEHGGSGTCELKLDLSGTLQNDSFLGDTKNYVSDSGNITVSKVTRITANSPYSHQLTLTMGLGKTFSDRLTLNKPVLPAWVEASNSDNAASLEHSKTFSLKYVIGGVADAYNTEKNLGTFSLSITNK